MTTTTAAPESQPFQAEVAELLHLMVHSVYSETDIFLRELISNASDACDKLRYEAIATPDLIADGAPPEIRIVPDKKANTLAVIDIGINQITDADGQTRIVGDVDTDAVKEVASWVTPVPGGVGPVTVAMFMRNAITAHTKQVAAGWI